MRNRVLFIGLFYFILLNCLNAPRNNKYDPDNPDKSEINGIIYEPDSLKVSGVLIYLINCSDSSVQTDTSDNSGYFSFMHINPGIYKIFTRTKYFKSGVIENESLWAGTKLPNYSIFFKTFHFEDDGIGSVPYGFNSVSGDWYVVADTDTNHIYNGSDDYDNIPSISLFRNRTQGFKFELKIRISSSSGENWEMGILLWYQNNSNYYCLRITKSFTQLCLIKDGVETKLYTKSLSTIEDIWHYVTTVKTEGGLLIYLDGNFLFPISLISTEFEDGYWGLYVFSRAPGITASVDFDDISLCIPN